MWQWLMDWLPDLKVGTFEIRDVLSLLMTGLGAFLAYRAIRMGRAQSRIGQEQMEIAKRQESLDVEQWKIAARQAEIAEKQHQIALQQLDRKAVLTIVNWGWSTGTDEENPSHSQSTFNLVIRNEGSRPARDIHCQVSAPVIASYEPRFEVSSNNAGVKFESSPPFEEVDAYVLVEALCPGPLYPGQTTEFGTLIYSMPRELSKANKPFKCEYMLACDDGRFPSEGYGILELSTVITFKTDQS